MTRCLNLTCPLASICGRHDPHAREGTSYDWRLSKWIGVQDPIRGAIYCEQYEPSKAMAEAMEGCA